MQFRRYLFGFLAALLSCPAGLLVAYLVGIVVTAIKTREFLATLLVAGSFLPLMLILVLLVPTSLICLISGVFIAALSDRKSVV